MYDTQWKCDINKNVLKIILLSYHVLSLAKYVDISILLRFYLPPSPRDFCIGLGVQASKETARKLKFKTSFNYCLSGSGQNSVIPVVCDVPE